MDGKEVGEWVEANLIRDEQNNRDVSMAEQIIPSFHTFQSARQHRPQYRPIWDGTGESGVMSASANLSEESRMHSDWERGFSATLDHDYPAHPIKQPYHSLPVSVIQENPFQGHQTQMVQWVAEPSPTFSDSDAEKSSFRTEQTVNPHSKPDELKAKRLRYSKPDAVVLTVKIKGPIDASKNKWFTDFGNHRPKDGVDPEAKVTKRYEDTIKALRESICKPDGWDSVEEANSKFTSFLGVEPKLKDTHRRPEGRRIEIRYRTLAKSRTAQLSDEVSTEVFELKLAAAPIVVAPSLAVNVKRKVNRKKKSATSLLLSATMVSTEVIPDRLLLEIDPVKTEITSSFENPEFPNRVPEIQKPKIGLGCREKSKGKKTIIKCDFKETLPQPPVIAKKNTRKRKANDSCGVNIPSLKKQNQQKKKMPLENQVSLSALSSGTILSTQGVTSIETILPFSQSSDLSECSGGGFVLPVLRRSVLRNTQQRSDESFDKLSAPSLMGIETALAHMASRQTNVVDSTINTTELEDYDRRRENQLDEGPKWLIETTRGDASSITLDSGLTIFSYNTVAAPSQLYNRLHDPTQESITNATKSSNIPLSTEEPNDCIHPESSYGVAHHPDPRYNIDEDSSTSGRQSLTIFSYNTVAAPSQLYNRLHDPTQEGITKATKTSNIPLNTEEPNDCIHPESSNGVAHHSDPRCNIDEDSSKNGRHSGIIRYLESIESIKTEVVDISSSFDQGIGNSLKAEREDKSLDEITNLQKEEFKQDGEPRNSEIKNLLDSDLPVVITPSAIEAACFSREEQSMNVTDKKTKVQLPLIHGNEQEANEDQKAMNIEINAYDDNDEDVSIKSIPNESVGITPASHQWNSARKERIDVDTNLQAEELKQEDGDLSQPRNSEIKHLKGSSEAESVVLTPSATGAACFSREERSMNAVDEETQVPLPLTNDKKKESKKDRKPNKAKVQKMKCFPKKSTLTVVKAPREIPLQHLRKSLRTSSSEESSSVSGLSKKDQKPTKSKIKKTECSSQPKSALPFIVPPATVPSKFQTRTSLPVTSTICKQEATKSSPCGNEETGKSIKKWYPSEEEQVQLYKNHSFVIESEHYNKTPLDAVIWRILDGKMLALQKYIPIDLNGRVIHKATASFRTPEAKNKEFFQKYYPIYTVKNIDTEKFQIFQYFNIDRILPQLLRMEGTKELYYDFKVFIQAISYDVCTWPAGFTKARVLADSDQCDEYYKTSWDAMESAVNDRAKSIAADSWLTSGLITPFRNYPIIKWSNNKESDRSCMACATRARKAAFKAEFIGKPYDQFTFEDLPGEFPPQENLYFCGTCVGYFKTIDRLVNHKWAMYRAIRIRITDSYCELDEDEHLDVDNVVECILNDHEWCIKCFLDFQVVLGEADVDIERLKKESSRRSAV